VNSAILTRAKAEELPVPPATTIELAIKLKIAAALGLTVPPTLLGVGDESAE
jgi:hypothetical protein